MKIYLALVALVAIQMFGTALAAYPYCIDVYNPKYPCPKNPDGSWAPDDVWPDPNPGVNGCSNQFFKCVNGLSYCYNCQPTLYYNPGSGECDYASNITACGGSTPNYSATPTNAVVTTIPTQPTTTQPTTTASTTTPTTTTASTTTPTTTTPTTTTPTTTTPTTTTPTTTTASTTTTRPTSPTTRPTTVGPFTCPPQNGFYPVPGYCGGNYYICITGVAYPMTCPNNNYFDPVLLHCVPPSQATCVAFECPDCNGNYPVPGTCTGNFYICVENQATLQVCPGGAIFDPQSHICVPEASATCKVCH